MAAVLLKYILAFCLMSGVTGSVMLAKLFEDLLKHYNKLARPVVNDSDTLLVKFRLKLSHIIDVHEKEQIMTTNMWVSQEWWDYKLRWDPKLYDGIQYINVPADLIWLPDIVLYNNADGNYQVTIMNKAQVWYNGSVRWEPPAIYKSLCEINVKWFPFDEQKCDMKFGSWTYDGFQLDLIHYDEADQVNSVVTDTVSEWTVDRAIDLREYYPSTEWDIMKVPGTRHIVLYTCCRTPFVDITFSIILRRKTLFYTVNLLIPCFGISTLTLLVFYLPAHSGEKISICISLLVSLTVFLLLLLELIPATSRVIPLIGRYLLFTMIMIAASVFISVWTLNIHYRGENAEMPEWVRKVFLKKLRRFLRIHYEPEDTFLSYDDLATRRMSLVASLRRRREQSREELPKERAWIRKLREALQPAFALKVLENSESRTLPQTMEQIYFKQIDQALLVKHHLKHMIRCVRFIASKIHTEQIDQQIAEEWKLVAMVIDRIFLWIFGVALFSAVCGIFLQAPSVTDYRQPLA